MILAIDPGLANCGWAVLRRGTARVIDLGILESKPDKAIAKSTDRGRRTATLVLKLRGIVQQHQCTAIAAEAMLFHGMINAVTSLLLPWGAIVGLAVCEGIDLIEVEPKEWQHAVLGSNAAVDYQRLSNMLAIYAGDQVGVRMRTIAESKHTHVLDAVGVGLYAALTKRNAVRVHRADARA